MSKSAVKSKAFKVALTSIIMSLLAVDFFLVYIPLSGWVLQSVLTGVLIEYLGGRKTFVLLAGIELMFIYSYGGLTALAIMLGVAGSKLFFPIIISSYLALIAVFLLLGYITNYLLHKIHLFENLNQKTA
ncbi:MAG: hypothetical protein NWE98_08340 [Candidatus Bathyarchaeota archaeon]|nr:hypothetical protein [Candidatus Bathyarchaeota archaeon]